MRVLSKWSKYFVDPKELERKLLNLWHEDDFVLSEDELRFQVNEKFMVEMLSIKYSNMLMPGSIVEWPSKTQMVFDLIRNGEKEQYKSTKVSGARFYGVNVGKLLNGRKIAYEVGDNDWYVFGLTVPSHCLYLQWRIPESFMIDAGMLSIRNQSGDFVHGGKFSIPLHVVGSNGENQEIQMKLTGKMPRSDCLPVTAKFLRVLRFE